MSWQTSVRLEHLSHLVSSWSKSMSGRSKSRARYQRTWGLRQKIALKILKMPRKSQMPWKSKRKEFPSRFC